MRDLFKGAEEFGFEGAPHDYASTLNKGHGRLERRECRVVSGPDCLDCLSTGREWPSRRPVARVTGHRETAARVTVQPRRYISSLEAPASRLLEAVRSH